MSRKMCCVLSWRLQDQRQSFDVRSMAALAAGSAMGFLFDGFVWLPVWRCVWAKSEECHGRKLAGGGQEWHHVTPEPDYQSRTIIGRRVGPAEPRGGKYFPTVREVHGFGIAFFPLDVWIIWICQTSNIWKSWSNRMNNQLCLRWSTIKTWLGGHPNHPWYLF